MSTLIDREPASSMGSPKRLAATAPEVSVLQSTPSNRGIAAANSYPGLSSTTIKYLNPWIEQDLQKALHCDHPNKLLRFFLRLASKRPELYETSSAMDTLMKKCRDAIGVEGNNTVVAEEIKSARNRYTQATKTKETDMYQPFVDMSTAGLKYLRDLTIDGMREADSEVNIEFKITDKKVISQPHGDKQSNRKPDVVIVPSRHNGCMEPTQDKEKGRKICWKDVLGFVEFKRRAMGEKTSKQSPAGLSNSDGVPPSGQQTLQPPTQSKSEDKIMLHQLNNYDRLGHQINKRKSESELEHHSSKRSKNSTSATSNRRGGEPAEAKVQTALYGAEMLSASVGVNYVISFTILDDRIWVKLFDHQGVICVQEFNFIQDLTSFMTLLYALQRFDLNDWGRVKGFQNLEDGTTEAIVQNADGKPVTLQLSNHFRVPQVALKGRGTEVLDVKVMSGSLARDSPAKDMVAKIYWAEERRNSEASILKVANEIAQQNEDVRGHVPELVLSHKFQVSTSNIRMNLGINEEDAKRGSRTLYLLVFPKLLPIWNLVSDHDTLKDVWVQCFYCHYALWKGGVHHRDISAANLMYYLKEGKAIGVVNDFDLATLAGCNRTLADRVRTGTIPFMAMELLQKQGQDGFLLHQYRHEVESFIWVFLWVSCQCINSDGTRREGFLAELGKVSATECAEKKANFINSFHDLPKDVHLNLRIFGLQCITFLRKETNARGDLKMALELNLTKLEGLDDSEPTAADIKEGIANLRAQLDGEDVDQVFREFSKAVFLPDVEEKVKRAAKGISPRVDIE